MLLERYIPPNLRGPIRDAGNIGYSILDNVIGIEDGYRSAGERFKDELFENPKGVAKQIGSGMLEGAKDLLSDPIGTAIGTAKGVIADVAQSTGRAAKGAAGYLPEGVELKSATMEQIRAANDAYTGDLFAMTGVIPAASGTRAAVRAAGNVDVGARTADAIGLGRSIASGDLEGIGEVFQRSGEARGLSADIKRKPVRGYDPKEISRLEANIGLRDERGRAKPEALKALASQFDAAGNRINNIKPDKKTGLTYNHPASNVRMNTPVEEQVVDSRVRGFANPRKETSIKLGDGLVAAFGDRVVADRDILGYAGQELRKPQSLFGGSGFIRDKLNEEIWASDEGVTSPLLASLNRAAQDGLNPRMIYTSMGAQSSDFATNELAREYIRDLDIDPEMRQLLADRLRASKDFTDKDFPFDDLISGGTSRRNWQGLLDGVDDYIGNMNGSNRRAIWQAMDNAKFRDAGLSIGEMRLAQTDPDLLYANPFDTGLNLGSPNLNQGISPTAMHPIYPTSIAGKYDGSLPVQVPAALTFRDFFNMRRGLLDGVKPSASASDQRSFLMSHGNIVSEADRQMVEEIDEFTEYWRAFNE